MSRRAKIALGIGIWFGGTVILLVIFGSHGKNTTYSPQDEFKLHKWVDLGIFSINQAVLYLFLAGILTCATMIYVARRMQQRPNRVQTLVEVIFQGLQNNIVGTNMDRKMAVRWFPFIATLALFIFFSNLVGFIPLPTDTAAQTINIFGLHIPPFSLYAATANLSIPLALALVVFASYTYEGVRKKGPIGYLRGLVPGGVHGVMAVFIFFLELLSNVMRLLSLSIRLFANILAGHLIILFMAGALAVLLGVAALGWFTLPFGIILFIFEVGLVAALQAFIFATLTAIYLGGAVADHH
ncbi:MAG TPA: F0F1 ATP synthase subunit A [Solirubrobacteraceae bacterium]